VNICFESERKVNSINVLPQNSYNKGLDSPNSKYQSTIQGNDIRSYWNWDVWKII